MAGVPAIALDGLTKYYGRQLGVEDVSFEVQPGEVFGFLGPNGAGKTTTLRMLVGLLSITRGSARVLGVDISSGRPGLRTSIGYLPGALALYKNLTGREYLAFMAKMRKRDLHNETTLLAERLQLDLGRHIHDLSKGNQQKIGVIQAFMHDPDVLVLDEPTSGLDPIIQREFEAMLAEATARGAAVLLSSHILSEVEHLSQRVAIINEGHLLVVEHIARLNEQSVRTLELGFDAPVDVARFASLPSIATVEPRGNELICRVVGAHHDVLAAAVELGVQTVRSEEPSLEEIFMTLVGGGGLDAPTTAGQDVA